MITIIEDKDESMRRKVSVRLTNTGDTFVDTIIFGLDKTENIIKDKVYGFSFPSDMDNTEILLKVKNSIDNEIKNITDFKIKTSQMPAVTRLTGVQL